MRKDCVEPTRVHITTCLFLLLGIIENKRKDDMTFVEPSLVYVITYFTYWDIEISKVMTSPNLEIKLSSIYPLDFKLNLLRFLIFTLGSVLSWRIFY